METREKRLMKNTTVLTIGTIFSKVIMFFMTPLFIRWLSQEDYGVFDIITTYVALIIPLVTLEIGQAAFRFLMIEGDNKNETITITMILSTIACIIISIILFFVSFFIIPIKESYISIVLYIFAEVFNLSLTMIARGKKRLVDYTLSNILYAMIMPISVYVLVYVYDLGMSGILLGYAIGYFVSNIYMFIKLEVFKNIKFTEITKKKWRDMLKYSIPLIPTDVSWWIMNVSDRTIVTVFLGATSNAILAVANKIPNICQTLFNVFHLSWQESAIDSLKDEDKSVYYSKIFNNLIKVTILICIVVMSCNFIFFDYIFTDEYYFGFYLVPILIISIIESMVAQFLGSIYIANMESKKSAYTTIYSAIINLIIHFVLINVVELYAAAISTLCAYLFLMLLRYFDINKKISIKFDNKNIIFLLILLYYFITTYINNNVLNIVNLILSGIIFIVFNKKLMINIIKRGKNDKKTN